MALSPGPFRVVAKGAGHVPVIDPSIVEDVAVRGVSESFVEGDGVDLGPEVGKPQPASNRQPSSPRTSPAPSPACRASASTAIRPRCATGPYAGSAPSKPGSSITSRAVPTPRPSWRASRWSAVGVALVELQLDGNGLLLDEDHPADLVRLGALAVVGDRRDLHAHNAPGVITIHPGRWRARRRGRGGSPRSTPPAPPCPGARRRALGRAATGAPARAVRPAAGPRRT